MGIISSIFNYKSQLAQAQADKEAAQLEHEAAMKQLEEQLKANKQQQEFNKAESELAFQRGSSLGQLQQLMSAGLSEQQARQIIAGGSTGGYTPASSVNQMSGVDYTAPAHAQAAEIQADTNAQVATQQFSGEILNNSTLGWIDHIYSNIPNYIDQAVGIGANVFQSSLTASDGGIIGNMQTASLQGQILRGINDIPAYARGSYAAFCQFASSSEAPAWMQTAQFQQALATATSSPMAMKSMKHLFDTSNQLLTGDIYFENLLNESKMKSSAAKIASFKVDQEKVATDLALLETEYKINILPERYSAILEMFKAEAAEMSTRSDLWNNDDYKKAWLASHLTQEEDAQIIAAVMKMKHTGEFKYLKDNPNMQQLFAVYQLFEDVGMTDTMFGEVIASLEAYGKSAFDFGVSDVLQACYDWIYPDTDSKKQMKEAKTTFWQKYLEYNHQPHK